MELCIELPLISCVDTYEDVESLRFYFDVNLEYLKRTLPKVLSYGFRHEIGRQYRFCVSCQKHSCIRSEIYDEAVTKYQTADIYASIPKQTGIEDTDMTVLGESSTVHSTIMLPKASCAVLELPFMGMTPILSCRSYITSDAGYFSRDSVNMRSLTPGKTAGTPVGKLVDAPFVPPSINRVTTTCTTGSSFQEDDINKCMKNDVIPQRIHQNSLKASIAMIELPREEYSMDEDPQLATINVADTVTSKYEKKNDVGTVTAGVEAINGEAEKVTAIGSTTDERVAEEELAPAAEELVPAETSKVIIKPRAVTLRVKKMRALKRIRQQKSKRASVKGGSPVPDRHYNVRGICSSGLRAVSGDGPCPQSILKHLKRATQLLLKRKKSTCAYVRREFDDIRNAIEARFHLVLCRCQERWNRVNATYTERLNEIMRSVGDDIKLPRLEALVKRLPEPIKLQPAPNVEPGTPALEAIRGGHDHEAERRNSKLGDYTGRGVYILLDDFGDFIESTDFGVIVTRVNTARGFNALFALGKYLVQTCDEQLRREKLLLEELADKDHVSPHPVLVLEFIFEFVVTFQVIRELQGLQDTHEVTFLGALVFRLSTRGRITYVLGIGVRVSGELVKVVRELSAELHIHGDEVVLRDGLFEYDLYEHERLLVGLDTAYQHLLVDGVELFDRQPVQQTHELAHKLVILIHLEFSLLDDPRGLGGLRHRHGFQMVSRKVQS
ncbi:vacuolar-sorting BRO1, putative [Babesia caballi]|uniref:Vacuolar-sorting BRO1, putative n=1 Tax=Babesia caballi TaxID=5871 RepID=A0AAV4LWA9_BABCB|nr:vacuolar-sorting BRO1, putative [Babesia caballi]